MCRRYPRGFAGCWIRDSCSVLKVQKTFSDVSASRSKASRCRDYVAYTSAKKDAYVSKLTTHHFYQMCTYIVTHIFLDSSMVEHSAVNRVVVGSSPTRGANETKIH